MPASTRRSSTFEHNGKQYVVALSAGSFFPGTKHGDSVWLFALNGGAATSGASGASSGTATGGDSEVLRH